MPSMSRARNVVLPPQAVMMRIVQELEPSAHDMLMRCFVQHAYGRMTDADIDSLLRSVAWQSRSMRAYQAYMQAYQVLETPHELLTATDIASLLADAERHQAD